MRGPGGAYRPDPIADWHLLVGDESALAITAALEELTSEAVARVVVLVDDVGHEPELPLPAGAQLTVLHRATLAEGQSLASAVRALEWLPGRVHAFVHGEAAEVMHDIRPYLLKERGLDRNQVYRVPSPSLIDRAVVHSGFSTSLWRGAGIRPVVSRVPDKGSRPMKWTHDIAGCSSHERE